MMSPPVDLTLMPAAGAPGAAWRALGGLAALDLDFSQVDRPALVSAALAMAAPDEVDTPKIWAMTLAERIGALIAIWHQTDRGGANSGPDDLLELVFRCPAAGCGSGLEVGLPVSALLAMADDARDKPETDIDGLVLRRPTGADQRNWRSARPRDSEATILSDLIVSGTPGPGTDLDALLQEFDPLTCFAVSTSCPDCNTASDLPVDLEAHLLGLLAVAQTRLFAQVDTLARRYGWTDAQITAMPDSRRARYLAMAKPEGGW